MRYALEFWYDFRCFSGDCFLCCLFMWHEIFLLVSPLDRRDPRRTILSCSSQNEPLLLVTDRRISQKGWSKSKSSESILIAVCNMFFARNERFFGERSFFLSISLSRSFYPLCSSSSEYLWNIFFFEWKSTLENELIYEIRCHCWK